MRSRPGWAITAGVRGAAGPVTGAQERANCLHGPGCQSTEPGRLAYSQPNLRYGSICDLATPCTGVHSATSRIRSTSSGRSAHASISRLQLSSSSSASLFVCPSALVAALPPRLPSSPPQGLALPRQLCLCPPRPSRSRLAPRRPVRLSPSHSADALTHRPAHIRGSSVSCSARCPTMEHGQ